MSAVPTRRARVIGRASLAPVIIALLAVSLTGSIVPRGKPKDVGLSAERLQRIDQVIQCAFCMSGSS